MSKFVLFLGARSFTRALSNLFIFVRLWAGLSDWSFPTSFSRFILFVIVGVVVVTVPASTVRPPQVFDAAGLTAFVLDDINLIFFHPSSFFFPLLYFHFSVHLSL